MTLIDYMYAREEEGMGPSIPLAVSTAVAWFERTAGTPDEDQLMSQTFPQMVMKELTRKLERKAPPVRRAPRWLGCFVAPMETLAVDGCMVQAHKALGFDEVRRCCELEDL